MAKYSTAAQNKIATVMHDWKEGDLKSGSGQKVTSQKQAEAIGISLARSEGKKVPGSKK